MRLVDSTTVMSAVTFAVQFLKMLPSGQNLSVLFLQLHENLQLSQVSSQKHSLTLTHRRVLKNTTTHKALNKY